MCRYARGMSNSVGAADRRTITFSARQLRRKFKHAADFGVPGPYNQTQATRFAQALRAHVEDRAMLVLRGTYRGAPVMHFVHPTTGLDVMCGADNAFISGWRLTPEQLTNVLTRGRL